MALRLRLPLNLLTSVRRRVQIWTVRLHMYQLFFASPYPSQLDLTCWLRILQCRIDLPVRLISVYTREGHNLSAARKLVRSGSYDSTVPSLLLSNSLQVRIYLKTGRVKTGDTQ